MKKKYYVTTPIYYVNDQPHIGHAYTSVIADIFARFKRLDGYDVIFSTGTDEHGQKVEKSAINHEMLPIEWADINSQKFNALGKILNLSYTNFIRTTSSDHRVVVHNFWNILEERGFIYLGKYKGWYSLKDEAFYGDNDIFEKDGKKFACDSKNQLEWLEEDSYFFKLSSFEKKLLDFYLDNPNFVEPRYRFNEVKSFVKKGLRDLSISRNTFSWGIKVPDNDSHIIYVWLDALLNYLTVLDFFKEKGKKFAKFWPADLQIIGKDIIIFHAVFFPAFLMAAGFKPAKQILAHGWWLNNSEKISKSKGNAISAEKVIAKYGLDAFRYFLVSAASLGKDANFTDEVLKITLNNKLANDLGNFCQRVLSFTNKHYATKILKENKIPKQQKIANLDIFYNSIEKYRKYFTDLKLNNYLEDVEKLIALGNKFFNDQKPWETLKVDRKKTANILWISCEMMRLIALYLQPIIPDSATKILDNLGIKENHRDFANIRKNFDFYINKTPEILFIKVE